MSQARGGREYMPGGEENVVSWRSKDKAFFKRRNKQLLG
jgi:hypothetical protein